MRKRVFMAFVLPILLSPVILYSQNGVDTGNGIAIQNDFSNSSYIDSIAVKILNLRMPSLDELFAAAATTPAVKMMQFNEEMARRELKGEKRQWLSWIKGNANYSYGVNNTLLTYEVTGVPIADNYSNQAQSYYLLGGGIQISLYDIFNMRNRIKAKAAFYDAQRYATENSYDDQKKLIIESYFKAQGNIYGLRDVIEYLSMARSTYEGAKVEFLNGHITQSDLLEEKIRVQHALENYIELVATIGRDLYILETLSNTKIISD